jgi:hypothetical protein
MDMYWIRVKSHCVKLAQHLLKDLDLDALEVIKYMEIKIDWPTPQRTPALVCPASAQQIPLGRHLQTLLKHEDKVRQGHHRHKSQNMIQVHPY